MRKTGSTRIGEKFVDFPPSPHIGPMLECHCSSPTIHFACFFMNAIRLRLCSIIVRSNLCRMLHAVIVSTGTHRQESLVPGRHFASLSLMLLTGCASGVGPVAGTSTPQVSNVEEINVQPTDNGIVCEVRKTTGSKIAQRICYERDARDGMQAHDQRVLLDEINDSSQREIIQSSMREAARSSR